MQDRRWRMRALVLTIGAASVAFGGCLAIAGVETLKFEPDNDGGGVPVDDGGGDPTTTDASIASDADGAPRVDAGRCTDGVIHDFCDDFEGVRTVQDTWSQQLEVNAASLSIESGSLIARIDHEDAGAVPNVAVLAYSTSWPWSSTSAGRPRVSLLFRARVDVCPAFVHGTITTLSLGGPDVLEVQVAPNGGKCVFRIGEIVVSDAGAVSYGYSGLVPITVGDWNDISFMMAPWPDDTQASKATLTVNGVPAPYTLMSRTKTETFSLYFGLGNGNSYSELAQVRLDDFRADFLAR